MLLKIERSKGWLYFEVDSVNVELVDREDFDKAKKDYNDIYFLHSEIDAKLGSQCKVMRLLWLYKNDALRAFIVISRNSAYLCGEGGKTLERLN